MCFVLWITLAEMNTNFVSPSLDTFFKTKQHTNIREDVETFLSLRACVYVIFLFFLCFIVRIFILHFVNAIMLLIRIACYFLELWYVKLSGFLVV